jgi:carotenoid cleavage dioxygenase-like enzyme
VRLPVPAAGNEWPAGFNGDGHVSSFRFANGSVDFKARYVKTDRSMAERRARKRLWGVYRNHFTDDPSVANVDRGAANTHIYWHGGKMLVLKEDALPYHIPSRSRRSAAGISTARGPRRACRRIRRSILGRAR